MKNLNINEMTNEEIALTVLLEASRNGVGHIYVPTNNPNITVLFKNIKVVVYYNNDEKNLCKSLPLTDSLTESEVIEYLNKVGVSVNKSLRKHRNVFFENMNNKISFITAGTGAKDSKRIRDLKKIQEEIDSIFYNLIKAK